MRFNSEAVRVTKTGLTIGSPTKSVNSVASLASGARKKVVVPSHKRKVNDVSLSELQMASKRPQFQLKDDDDLSLTAEAAGQSFRDQ